MNTTQSYPETNGLSPARQIWRRKRNSPGCAIKLSAERRTLPWVKIEKNYVFDGPNGKETLADLFAGRSQLIVYHFMLGPDGRRAAWAARSWPTISTALSSTSPTTT